MKVNFCVNCGYDYDFIKVPDVDTKIHRSTSNPVIEITHEYDHACTKCGHYQHIIDRNFAE